MNDRERELECVIADLTREAQDLRAQLNRQVEAARTNADEIELLRAELDAANRLAEYWKAEHLAANAELDALKAQEPFDAEDSRFRETFDAVIRAGNWQSTRQNYDYRSPMMDMTWRVAFAVINRLKLYARPIPPAPSVPDGWLATLKKIDETLGRAYKTCPIEREAEIIQARIDIKVLADHMTRAAAPKPEGE